MHAAFAETPRTADEVAKLLSAEEQRRLSAEPDLKALFDTLTTEALKAGPGRPGACGNNPFWSWSSSGADLATWRLFERASFTVGLERRAAAQRAAA